MIVHHAIYQRRTSVRISRFFTRNATNRCHQGHYSRELRDKSVRTAAEAGRLSSAHYHRGHARSLLRAGFRRCPTAISRGARPLTGPGTVRHRPARPSSRFNGQTICRPAPRCPSPTDRAASPPGAPDPSKVAANLLGAPLSERMTDLAARRPGPRRFTLILVRKQNLTLSDFHKWSDGRSE